MNVIAECLERGHVKHSCLIWQSADEALAKELVERGQECGQGFSGTRRRGNEDVSAGLNSRPAALLRLAWRSELLFEPLRHRRMKTKFLH